MKVIVWLAVNGLRWLLVVAFIAWANPQPMHVKPLTPVALPAPLIRTIQIAPCPPWSTKLGTWAGANVCASYPASQSSYLHRRWRHR